MFLFIYRHDAPTNNSLSVGCAPNAALASYSLVLHSCIMTTKEHSALKLKQSALTHERRHGALMAMPFFVMMHECSPGK